MAMRHYMRGKMIEGKDNSAILEEVGLTPELVEDMYKIMAIANYEDRFVIPSSHREYASATYDAFGERGGCGFSFGNGCSPGTDKTNLFGGKKINVRRADPIRVEKAE